MKKKKKTTMMTTTKEKKSKLDVTIAEYAEVVVAVTLRAGSSFTLLHIRRFEKTTLIGSYYHLAKNNAAPFIINEVEK